MSRIPKTILLLFILMAFSVVHSQDRKIDSLKLFLRNPKVHDTTKLTAIETVMDANYTENDPKFYYLNTLIGDLAQKNLRKKNNKVLHETYTSWLAAYYNIKAIDYAHRKDAIHGLAALDKSIALYKSIKAYEDAHYGLIVKGSFYSQFNENTKAISCLFTALKYFEKDKKNNASELAYAMSTLGDIYSKLWNFNKSIQCYKKSVEYLSVKGAFVGLQNDHMKCVAYANIAADYISLEKFPEAIEYNEKALVLAKQLGDRTNISLIYSKVGYAQTQLFAYEQAETSLQQALEFSTNDLTLSQCYIALGTLYREKHETEKALDYIQKALTLGKKLNDLGVQEKAQALLSWIYGDLKDYKKSAFAARRFYKLSDSIRSIATKNVLAQEQLKYDFEKKELNTKLRNEHVAATKNLWIIGISALLLMVLLGGYFYHRNNRQKQAITVMEKEQFKQKLLISQMNPHFIFNSIQNIRALINNRQDAAAVNYLDRFSKLTRQILENSTENYIELAEELEMTENYLSIQQLLYDNKFEYTIDVDEAIDVESIFLPPMLTQPFIENAIKHGLSTIQQNGIIAIRFYMDNGRLFFEVSDNGKGFEVNKNTGNHKSLAMKITQERLSHYTKNADSTIQISNVTDVAGSVKGAQVNFEIPYIYEN